MWTGFLALKACRYCVLFTKARFKRCGHPELLVLHCVDFMALFQIFTCYADQYDKRAKQSGIFMAGSSKRIVGFNEL